MEHTRRFVGFFALLIGSAAITTLVVEAVYAHPNLTFDPFTVLSGALVFVWIILSTMGKVQMIAGSDNGWVNAYAILSFVIMMFLGSLSEPQAHITVSKSELLLGSAWYFGWPIIDFLDLVLPHR